MKAHHIDSPQSFTLQEFRSTLAKHKELADACRFAIQIPRNKDMGLERDLQFLCFETELPGRSLVTNEFRYYGPSFKMPSNSQYEQIDLNFIVREYMAEKYYFDEWIDKINPKTTYDFAYRSSYETEIHIFQISEIFTGNKNKPVEATYKMTLRNAYPIAVAALPLSWGEEAYHKLRVTFTYTDWYNSEEKIKTNEFKLVRDSDVRRTGGTALI